MSKLLVGLSCVMAGLFWIKRQGSDSRVYRFNKDNHEATIVTGKNYATYRETSPSGIKMLRADRF